MNNSLSNANYLPRPERKKSRLLTALFKDPVEILISLRSSEISSITAIDLLPLVALRLLTAPIPSYDPPVHHIS